LTLLCRAAVEGRLLIDELDRHAAARVFRAAPPVVGRDARGDVRRYAGVQRAVGTADDVDGPSRHGRRALRLDRCYSHIARIAAAASTRTLAFVSRDRAAAAAD